MFYIYVDIFIDWFIGNVGRTLYSIICLVFIYYSFINVYYYISTNNS